MHPATPTPATPYQRRATRLALSDLVDLARTAAATLTAHGLHLEARGLREAADAVDPPADLGTADPVPAPVWATSLPRRAGRYWTIAKSDGRALSFETLSAAKRWAAEHPVPGRAS